MIWDFRGPDSEQTAVHHELHLKEYTLAKDGNKGETGYDVHSEFHSSAFLVIDEERMTNVRDELLPHRGEYVET